MRDDIVTDLTAALVPPLRTITTHPGRMDREELLRISLAAPAGYVAALGAEYVQSQPQNLMAEVAWAFFVVTRGTSIETRDKQALAVIYAAMRRIVGNRWGNDLAQVAKNVRWENLYSGTLDKTGLALHAVLWTQAVEVVDENPTTLDDFVTLFAEYDLAEADNIVDADDTIAPVQI